MDEFKTRFISWIGKLLLIVIGRSLRISNVGYGFTFITNRERAIYAFWHDCFFPLIYFFRPKTNRFRNTAVLVSEHRDGECLARIIKPFGYRIVKATSTDTGRKGLFELLKLDESSLAIAPDGPKGPRHKVKDGVLRIAKHTGLPIIPIGIGISNKITFGSWDRFNLPIPFSRCVIYWDSPIWVEEIDEYVREYLETTLTKINTRASALL
ncbi:MAG: DUF374 domain-containing protein [bacterium]|nr:DUF374 domain-containing protein [bacterium]